MEASLLLQAEFLKQLELLGFKVFDFLPPKTTKYPFIIIGDDRQSSLGVKNGDYVDINSTLTVFSDYQGLKEVKQILEQIKNVGVALTLQGWGIVGATVTDSFTTSDTEEQVTQGIIEIKFRALKGEI